MDKKAGLVVIFLLLIFYQGSSQFLHSLKELKKSKHSVKDKISKIDSLVQYAESSEFDSLAYLYIRYAYWMYDYDLPKTIILSEKSKKEALKSNANDSTLFYKIYLDLGYYYKKNLDYKSAISCYKEGQKWTNSNIRLSKIYAQIGFCYDKLKDYYRSVKNYKIATGFLDSSENQRQRLINYNYDISVVLAKQNTLESLIESRLYAKKVDSLCIAHPHLNTNEFRFKFHHAEIYNNDLSLDTLVSSKLFKEAFDLAYSISDTARMIETLYGLGGLFNSTNQEKSKQFHYKAFGLIDKEDSINLHMNWYALGKTLAYEGKYDESSQLVIKALKYLTGKDFSEPKELVNQNVVFHKNADDLIYSLPLLGEVYLKWYEETSNKQLLDKSLEYFQFTDRIIDAQKENSKDFLSRLLWRKKGTDLYGKALRVCFLLNDHNQALYFMEKNKALLLMEDISQKEMKKSSFDNPHFLHREMTLKKEILSVANHLKNGESSEKKLVLQKQKMNLEIDLSLLQDSIYGHKKTLQYDPIHLEIEDVQKKLAADEIFIEYHISVDNEHSIYSNNEKGYVLIISKKNSELLEIGELDNLYTDIKKLTTALKKPLNLKSEIDDYNKLTYGIFLRLFPNHKVRKLLEGKKLILSLDYYLHSVPFEALSTSSKQTGYLIHKAEISYVYSHTFGENNIADDRPNVQNMIAFAPQVFMDRSLIPLKHTESEIDVIEEKFKGKYYKKSKANKQTFLDESSECAIIHLATHAYSSTDSTPWISFYDEKLTLDELYLTENSASLVVLSACNTNIGKLEIGEGVMSLARGFFYGGTQSVVSTLWNVDDKSTSFILKQFYSNLKKGDNKSHALHNAKLTYLENNSLSELSPYYWSSFVLLGDTAPIEFKDSTLTNSKFILASISTVLIIIMLLLFFKKR